MEWIITADPNEYKIFEAFHELSGVVDWKQGKNKTNIKESDYVFIYVCKPYMKIMYKTKVIKVNIPFNDKINDEHYWVNGYDINLKDLSFIRLQLVRFNDNDDLSLLRLHELMLYKGNIQGVLKSESNKPLFKYLNIFNWKCKNLRKVINISKTWQLEIPEYIYRALNINDEFLIEYNGSELIIRSTDNDFTNFSIDFLKDPIEENYKGDALINEFTKRKRNIPKVVETLKKEAMNSPAVQGNIDDYIKKQ